jgi:carboxyl-terminal processing protease
MVRKASLVLLAASAGAAMTLVTIEPRIVFEGSRATAAVSDTYRHLALFGDVFERVRTDYVEKPDENKLIESAINGMLTALDPHSYYLDHKSFRELEVQTADTFPGLGIEFNLEDGLVKVIAPIDGSPAHKAGVMSNDIITHLDDESLQGLTVLQAIDKMRGPVNTKVRLKVVHMNTDRPVEITIIRDVIQMRGVHSNLNGEDVGYIRITQFNEQTTDGVRRAIADLANQAGKKLKGYVVDLRNNPGGLVDQAIAVADAFLEKGEIVSTRRRNARDTQRFNARAGDLAKGKVLMVLINGGSASASEILAGALQHHKRATIIGTRSFGKGSVQTIIPIGPGNGALRLTTARYYTPSGRSIQARGIVPDIEVLQDVPEELKARTFTESEASLRGHLSADGREEKGSQSYVPPQAKDDKALNLALGLLRGTSTNAAYPPARGTAN